MAANPTVCGRFWIPVSVYVAPVEVTSCVRSLQKVVMLPVKPAAAPVPPEKLCTSWPAKQLKLLDPMETGTFRPAPTPSNRSWTVSAAAVVAAPASTASQQIVRICPLHSPEAPAVIGGLSNRYHRPETAQ